MSSQLLYQMTYTYTSEYDLNLWQYSVGDNLIDENEIQLGVSDPHCSDRLCAMLSVKVVSYRLL